MKCYNHPERDAVAMCNVCGKFLCKECADKHNPIMCDDCYEKSLQQEQAAESGIQSQADTSATQPTPVLYEIGKFLVLAVAGALLVWLFYDVIDNGGQQMGAIHYFTLFFVPFAFNGVRYFGGSGCLMLILKFILAWYLGVLFFIWEVIKIGRRLRLEASTRGGGIAKEVVFYIANIIIVALFYFFMRGLLLD